MPQTDKLRLPLILAALILVWLVMLLGGGPGSATDQQVLESAAHPALVAAAQRLTKLGNAIFLVPATLAMAAFFLFRGGWKKAAILIFVAGSGRLIVEFQKIVLDRARPDPAGHLDAVHSMAFPSAHAANTMIFALTVALLAATNARIRVYAVTIALAFSFLIGLTRLVLAVHWPSDMVGGWAFGAAWALVLVRLTQGRLKN